MADKINPCAVVPNRTVPPGCRKGFGEAGPYVATVVAAKRDALTRPLDAQKKMPELLSAVDSVVSKKESACHERGNPNACGFLIGIAMYERYFGAIGTPTAKWAPTTTPIKPLATGYIVMEANGDPSQEVLFDTGAAMTIFSKTFVRDHGANFLFNKKHEGYDIGMYSAKGIAFMFGTISFRPQEAIESSSIDVMEGTDRHHKLIGIAGMQDFATGHAVEMNYDRHELIMDQNVPKRLTEDRWEAIPLRAHVTSGGLYGIDLYINDTRVSVFLDTGASEVSIRGACADSSDFEGHDSEEVAARSVSGVEIITSYKDVNLRLGRTLKFTASISLEKHDPMDAHLDAVGNCGLLGLSVLRRTNFIIDPASMTLFIQPRKSVEKEMPGLIAKGFIPERAKDGSLSVNWIIPGGLADKNGIRKGDEILTINGISTRNISIIELRELELKSSVPMRIVFRRGDEQIPMTVAIRKSPQSSL